MAKIIARHLSIDMYNCKPGRMSDPESSKNAMLTLFEKNGFMVCESTIHAIDPEHEAMIFIFTDGHCTVHFFKALDYVAIDLFICKSEAAPEKFFSGIRDMFKPDKTKTTLVKRGDFGTIADMKPKISTKMVPLRRIHNTGARIVRMLAHRKK